MKNSKTFLMCFLLLMIIVSCKHKEAKQNFPLLQGAYFGQTEPGNTPELFAPGLLNTGLYTRDMAISPDGKEMYFSIAGGGYAVIMQTKMTDGKWTEPVVAPFSGSTEYFDFEPHISPDGSKLFFLSTRPRKGKESKGGWVYQNIWTMDKTENGWGIPYDLTAINTDLNEYFPSAVNSGALYFTRSDQVNSPKLMKSDFVDGEFIEAVEVVVPTDTSMIMYNTFVAPDESYLITGAARKNNIRIGEYYVSFKQGDGSWSELIEISSYIDHTGDGAVSPYVSTDGKFLFFGAVIKDTSIEVPHPGQAISELVNIKGLPQTGSSNIYWIETGFLTDLMKRNRN